MINTSDFYIGIGPHAQWIGSCKSDSIYALPKYLFRKEEWYRFLTAVLKFVKSCPDHFIPFKGDSWPWDWPNSSGSDYSYYFDHSRKLMLLASQGFPYYCSALAVHRGNSLEESATSIKVEYPPMKTYTAINREGEIIIIHGQYTP